MPVTVSVTQPRWPMSSWPLPASPPTSVLLCCWRLYCRGQGLGHPVQGGAHRREGDGRWLGSCYYPCGTDLAHSRPLERPLPTLMVGSQPPPPSPPPLAPLKVEMCQKEGCAQILCIPGDIGDSKVRVMAVLLIINKASSLT